jgi:hypothetical protein
MLNIMARLFGWNLPGLDGYAGYAIAAALFLALPAARCSATSTSAPRCCWTMSGPRPRHRWSGALALGVAISLACTWPGTRAAGVGVVHLHDVASRTGDATPLWIPQI